MKVRCLTAQFLNDEILKWEIDEAVSSIEINEDRQTAVIHATDGPSIQTVNLNNTFIWEVDPI